MILVGAQTPTRVHKSIKELNPSFKTKLKKKGNFCSWNKEKCIACELFSYWTQGVQITFFSIQHELRALIYYVQILNHTILVNHLGCLLFFFLFLWFCISHPPVLYTK